MNAGFDEKASIDLLILRILQAAERGNPVTMDMSVIDCQSGYMHCMKLGCGIHLYQAGQVGGDYPVNDTADGGVRTGRL